MNLNRKVLLAATLFISSLTFCQKNKPAIQLRSGAVQIENNIRQSQLDSFNNQAVRFNKKAFAIIQFESIPGLQTRKILSGSGIELLEYIPVNAYTATISGNAELSTFRMAGIKSLIKLTPEQKMDVHLAKGEIPSWAIRIQGTADVWISFPRTFSGDEVSGYLKQLNIDIVSTQYKPYRILSVRIASNRLHELASLPFIEYVQPVPAPIQPLNFNSRYGSRANLLNASVANGGKGLNGEGVVAGIGDNADVQTHTDFTARLIDRSYQPFAAHGHHTTGTMAGAGNIMELYRGYAPKVTIVSESFNGIIDNSATYVNDYGMVVTNNSYGIGFDCNFNGTYDLTSRILDQMAADLPNLEHVFAAGNSGTSTCSPYAPGYKTVFGSYQSAKNVITVGATNDSGRLSDFSSRGPVKDGRVKPEIVAMGETVASTWPGNGYSYDNGTSMAAPAVTGGLTLLYQRYRQLNSGSNPKNGFMKAIICNGATDRGNPGPDYNYGYGWMNLLRSVDMLENNHYFVGNSLNSVTDTHIISIPANTAQLKVMLYWTDPAASALSNQTLVNDLDLTVTDPLSTVVLPNVLDTTVANVGNNATAGADHINNMEQVVINNPAAGTYTLKVKGTAINQNPSQEYYLVYDPIPVHLKITAPAGGEGLAPSTTIYDRLKISWEAYGFSSGSATIELSTDNGITWNTIEPAADINRSIYTWWVPNIVTSQALIRVTKNGSGETATSNAFTIIGQPVVSLDAIQCEGYINLNWIAVTGATDYEVMMLRGDDMKPIAITSGTSYTFSGLSKDSTYWVTVRARVNGKPGRRATAISRQPNNGTCSGTISDNDLKLDAVISPVTGRKFTSTQLGSASAITVRIKNLDDAAASSFTVSYSINGGAWLSENVSTILVAGGSYNHTFITTADLSAAGTYILKAVVKNSTTDPITTNDTLVVVVKNLDNQPLNLTSYFVDDLESATSDTYQTASTGLNGLDRYDYLNSTVNGRLRTFVNSGISHSGSRAISLDDIINDATGNTNYLTGTYNLSGYNSSTNDIRLDFQFNNHGQFSNANNRVWIRGDEFKPWIEVYSLDDNENDPGNYKKTSSIELSRILLANAQDFSTSFQVRWGQFGQFPMTNLSLAAGYTFDDIRIYQAVNDLQIQSIDAPVISSCGLTNASIIKISVKNSSNSTLTNVPVKYRVNGSSWVSEIIPSIAANTTFQYSFTGTADFSAFTTYDLQAIVDYSTDSFRENDSTSITIVNSPIISTFPYIQNFEADNGSWYTEGKNISWEYGTPNSSKISRAASGAKAWKTRLTGNYNDNELSYLYSPCFNTSSMTVPTLSFNAAIDLEDCGATLCDGTWVEYSSDGKTWIKLGGTGGGTNWYNKTADSLWSIRDYTRWHVATIGLPTGINNLHLRFVFKSDPATNYEGIAIDDIHIYDNTYGIYTGPTMTAPISQTISGSNWIDFLNGGKLIASLQPNSQNLGITSAQTYININAGNVRHTATQYYHDRNITIKPAIRSLADSVTVRFYFTDHETDSLIIASGCSSCSKPSSVVELGISKYTDLDTSLENGTISDNRVGLWTFIFPDQVIKVPFDKGYYAEFKVKDFSEFWLNNGGFGNNFPLPVTLIDFTAQKTNLNNVLVKWSTGIETDVFRFEIEVSKENSNGQYTLIGSVPANGNNSPVHQYSFTDKETNKSGKRYYRLKIIDIDGKVTFSPVRTVFFDEIVLWKVFPNPSNGLFYFAFQLSNSDVLNASIIDSKGSLIKEYHTGSNGTAQKLAIDLADSRFASGVYLLQTEADGKKQVFKLYKK